MILYLSTIIICTLIIIGVNLIINNNLYSLPIWYIFVAVIVSVISVIIIDGILAFLVNKLPEKWFTSNHKIFNVSKKEEKFYKKLGIKNWKDKVIELGGLKKFRKNKVYDPSNNEYINKFLIENNYGQIVHICGIFLGFLIIFIFPLKYALMFGVPVAIVNAVLNIMPTMILRYNIPRLKILFERNKRNEANNHQEKIDKEE